ncbi:MAG: A24 family peptidase [Planctomycetales bacterium]
MPEMDLKLTVFLLAVGGFTLAAAISDFRTRRIPNALTLPMFLAGFVYQGVFGGWSGTGGLAAAGVGSALAAFGLGFGLLFVLWMVGGGGGGDVKFMGALAVWLGFQLTLLVLAVSTAFVLVGTLAVLAWNMFSRGPFGTRAKFIATSKPAKAGRAAPSETLEARQGRRIMAYAMPVAAATWVVAVLKFSQL